MSMTCGHSHLETKMKMLSHEEYLVIEQIMQSLPRLPGLARTAQEDWMSRGRCFRGGPEITSKFFPLPGESSREAIGICRGNGGCPVRTECLEYALADPNIRGVWGGKTGRQRKKILEARRSAA